MALLEISQLKKSFVAPDFQRSRESHVALEGESGSGNYNTGVGQAFSGYSRFSASAQK